MFQLIWIDWKILKIYTKIGQSSAPKQFDHSRISAYDKNDLEVIMSNFIL